MKGIVVELNGKYAIVLNKNGEFLKVKNRGNFAVGYEIDIESKVVNFNIKALSKVASIAAVLVLVCGVSVGAYAYNTPCNYVNVDINPSMEFSLNIFNRVLDVKGLNDDGKNILKDKSYKNVKIDDAVEDVIEKAVDGGFLGESSQNAVMITVSGKDSEKISKIQEELENAANVTLDQDKIKSEVLTEKITLSKRDDAKELGISPGKLVLIEKLKEVNPDVVVEDYKDKDVKDIVASIKETRKGVPENKDKNNKLFKNTDNSKKEENEGKIKGNENKGKKDDIGAWKDKEDGNKVNSPGNKDNGYNGEVGHKENINKENKKGHARQAANRAKTRSNRQARNTKRSR